MDRVDITNSDAAIGRSKNQRESALSLLIAVIKESPALDKAQHISSFRHLLLSSGYEDFMDVVIANWCSLQYSTARRAAFPPTKEELQAHAERVKEQRAREEEAVKKAKSLIASRLLDHVMPNGKLLRDCTGGECMEAGDMFAKIGKKVGKNNVVGDVLTAADIVKLVGKLVPV